MKRDFSPFAGLALSLLTVVSAWAAEPAADLAAQAAALRSPADAVRLTAIKSLRQCAAGIKPLVQTLTFALSDKSIEVRQSAARALGEIGASARDAVPGLVALLNDKDETVRAAAAQSLGEIGTPTPEAYCVLDYLLEDPSATVRARVAHTLGKFGQYSSAGLQPAPAIDQVPLVATVLNDPSAETAMEAALALAAMGRPAPEAAGIYVLALGRSGTETYKLAEGALRTIGTPGIDALTKTLSENVKDPTSRREAAALLGRLGESAHIAIPALTAALADKDVETQNRAAQALVELGAAPLEASPALVRLARESNAFRSKSLAAFESMGDQAVDYPLSLLKLTAKGETLSRREAARILVRLAPHFKQNPEPLLTGLNDADDTVRALTLEALAASGADSKALVRPLTAALNDPHTEIAQIACKSLAAMSGEPEALMALAELRVRGTVSALRTEAGKAVLAAGPRALHVLPVLREALKNKDDYVRDWAMQVLQNIGPAAADAIPDVAECLIQFKASRKESARTLGKLGANSIGPLVTLLNSSEPDVRRNAAAAIGLIGAPALAKVTAALASENTDTVEAAAAALEAMAPDSAPAIPELIRLLSSKTATTKYAAQQALAKLGLLAAPALISEIKKNDIAAGNTFTNTLALTGRKSVPLIVETLQAEQDCAIVCALLDTLARIGPGAADSMPAVLEVVARPYGGKDHAKVWGACAGAMGAIGTSRDTTVPVLFGMLSSIDKNAHSEASQALRKVGGEDLRVPSLTEALRNSYPTYVGSALKPFGPAGMLQLLAEMQADEPAVRDAAARSFVPLYPTCVPFLIEKLNEKESPTVGIILALGELRTLENDKRTGKAAAKVVEEMHKTLEPTTAELMKKIQNGTPDEALAALWAIGQPVGASPKDVLKHFAACAPDLHAYAIATLGFYDMKGQARHLVPVLPHLLKCVGGNSATRKQALAILQAAGYVPESVPALAAVLEDPDSSIRATATVALKGLGPAAVSAVPLLIQILDRGTPQMAAAASTVLESIGPDGAPQLLLAMRSENPKLRTAAVTLLLPMKLNAHLKLLAEAAKDERDEIAVASLHMIGALKEEGRPAEAAVRALLTTPDDNVFEECVKTLEKMGVNVFRALAPLADDPNEDFALRAMAHMHVLAAGDETVALAFVKKMLKKENPKLRAAAVRLLPGKETGAPLSFPLAGEAQKDAIFQVRVSVQVWLYDNAQFSPDAALPLLLAGISDDVDSVAVIARRSLMALGEKAKPVMPELRKLLSDPRRSTQGNAARVLIKLGAENEPLAALIFSETNVRDKIGDYQASQERFFEEHFGPDNVHYYAPTFLETWGTAAKDYAASNDPDGVFNLSGYKLKVLTAQSARAEGGKKEWLVKGFLTSHALLAWPTQPGVNGRIAYLCGPDGCIYERAFTAEDLADIAEWSAAFDPGPEWTKTFVPEKPAQRPVPHDYFKPNEKPSEQMEF